MKKHFVIGLKLTLITMVMFGFIYPIFITGIAKLIAPGHGKGETLEKDGNVVGFKIIGQSFVSDKYFNSRPSAVNYNAAATGGTNKSNSNPDYLNTIQERIAAFMSHNPDVKKSEIPVDLITASGGGLDPHISIEATLVQVQRIARIRNIPEEKIKRLVEAHIERPLFGVFGTSKVNVLELNLALDNEKL